MSVTRSIAKALLSTTEPVVLATVVRVTGSSYGGVGTRMVIPQNAPPIGIVSGGCLESDLAEHARQVQETHRPKVVTYDTRADDDAAWGLGLGCNGLIDVLLEPLTPEQSKEIGDVLMRGLDRPTPSVLATVLETEGEPDCVGHALFDEDLIHTTGWKHTELLAKIREDSEAAFAESRRGIIREYGPITIAFEVIFPSIELLICGSGPDVGPLVDIAAQLDWNLTVIDHRPVEYAHPERFPRARVIECPDPKSLSDTVSVTRATAAVVMSHNYGRDLDYVRTLLGTEVGYIGILGPRARTERMLADIASAGETITRGDRIYSPVGLDTGGDGPERIALSIIAEVAAVISGTSAGHLRDSSGSLHPAPVREVAEKS